MPKEKKEEKSPEIESGDGKLLMFYGTECVHCHEMFPNIEKLEKEEGVKVEKLEIWHDSKNRARYDKSNNIIKCTGVPFFYNENSGKGICGTTDYGGLKKWAKGKVMLSRHKE